MLLGRREERNTSKYNKFFDERKNDQTQRLVTVQERKEIQSEKEITLTK